MSWLIPDPGVASGGGPRRRSLRRKFFLDVDLNAPPIEQNDEGTSSNPPGLHPTPQFPPLRGPVAQIIPEERSIARLARTGGLVSQYNPNAGPAAVILDDDDDDDVVLLSPRSFAEARNNSRRNRSGQFLSVAAEALIQLAFSDDSSNEGPSRGTNNRNVQQRVSANQPVVHEFFSTRNNRVVRNQPICVQVLDLDTESPRKRKERVAPSPPPPPPPPPPPQPEPTFTCPVCMGPLVEETSTKCGHIFCKRCIKTAITAQHKCPTCRKKLAMKDTIRIYLPALN